MKRHAFTSSLALLLLAACAAPSTLDPTAQASVPVLVKLNATAYNAGEIGQASLIADKGSTRIVLNFSGVPPNTTRPVHVYTYIYEGTCSQLPETPAYSLTDKVLVSSATGMATRAPFTLSHSVSAPLDDLLSGRYALALRSAPADGNWVIYCGELRRS